MRYQTQQVISQTDVAHLLKTPLSVIKAQARLAQMQEPDQKTLDELTSAIDEQVEKVNLIFDCLRLIDGFHSDSLEAGDDLVDLSEFSDRNGFKQFINADRRHIEVLATCMNFAHQADGAETIELDFREDLLQAFAKVESSTLEYCMVEAEENKIGRFASLMMATIKIIGQLYGYDLEIKTISTTSIIRLRRHALR